MAIEQMIANLMYTDRMCVLRSQAVIDPSDGTTTYEYLIVNELQDIPCHVSFSKQDQHNSSAIDLIDGVTTIKIFCDSSLDLRKGDYIKAFKTIGGRSVEYDGYVGKPIFGLTQEVVLLSEAPA